MKDDVTFSPEGFQDYLHWQSQDKRTLDRINRLIRDIQRNGMSEGIGKPEALRNQDGWSRRIDEKNRLIYREENGNLYITSCRGHYKDH